MQGFMEMREHLLLRGISAGIIVYILSYSLKRYSDESKLQRYWSLLALGHISFLFYPFVKEYILENPLVHLFKIGFSSFPFFLWISSKYVFNEHSGITLYRWLLLISVNLLSISFFRHENTLYFINGTVAPKDFVFLCTSILLSVQIYLCLDSFIRIYRSSGLLFNDPSLFLKQYFLVSSSGGLLFTIFIILLHSEEKSSIRMWSITLFHLAYVSISGFFLILKEKSQKIEVQEFNSLTEEEKGIIEKRLNNLIEIEKIYLQDTCSLKLLSQRMELPEYKIRRYILDELKYVNFNHFLNSYRIKEAERILQAREYSGLPIQRVALLLGYNSVKTFNRVFKEYKNLSPIQYKNQQLPNS